MLIRLSDEDRKRLGIDEEWLDYRLDRVSVNQAIVLQHEGGYRGGLGELRDAWNAQIVADDAGVVVDMRIDYQAFKAWVWLAVANHGVKVSYTEFDFDFTGMQWRASDTAEESDQGKGDLSTPTRTSPS